MAYQQNQWRVCVEFLKANQPGHGRIIRLNYAPNGVPPQLMGRIHPAFWQAFMEEAGQLSLRHPFVARPSAKNYCTWAACFGLGAVVGLFCISPDAGDYGVWDQDCRRFVARWAPGWAQAGCTLSVQHARDWWLQIDLNPSFAVGQPVAPPLPPPLAPQQPPHPARTSSSSDQQQQQLQPAAKPPKVV
ncbi:hypothetical protein CHLNCDRAFT_54922 [Chlorella variabilis]|uniref:Uncharacterized protein n=1 Tax=Chlorella variabilis TaxID=554065 RepID=E1ZR37_CHLVA|nr:hypothetical protein CHLNCDRAFT_54922 [Chlorella variabilis]EFN51662.1 hypothetical protein CHLNCDRAFT_54922 [Chlorella variabilis]|eukprot:XP_005843764.1 hypothetical protein CHLNCDRAFT_54922 [Chlorella variabilis]